MSSAKRNLDFLVCTLLVCSLFLTACKYNSAVDGEDGSSHNINKSENSFDVTDNFDLIYDVYVPIKSLHDSLMIKEYYLPAEIDGLIPRQVGMLSESKCLLILDSPRNSDGNINEQIGLYGICNNAYGTIYVQQKNESVNICFHNDEMIIFKSIYDGGARGEINLLMLDDGECITIHELCVDPVENQISTLYSINGLHCDGKYIYFDDLIVTNDGASYWETYRYDIDASYKEAIFEHAQNPIPYKGGILLFTQNTDGKYNVLSSETGRDLYEVGTSIRSISSNGDDVYCIATPLTSHAEMHTYTELRDLLNNKIILSTNHTISNVICDKRYISFINYTDEYVCIYDITDGVLLVANTLPKGMSYVFTHGDCGSIVTFENAVPRYFYFEPVQ